MAAINSITTAENRIPEIDVKRLEEEECGQLTTIEEAI